VVHAVAVDVLVELGRVLLALHGHRDVLAGGRGVSGPVVDPHCKLPLNQGCWLTFCCPEWPPPTRPPWWALSWMRLTLGLFGSLHQAHSSVRGRSRRARMRARSVSARSRPSDRPVTRLVATLSFRLRSCSSILIVLSTSFSSASMASMRLLSASSSASDSCCSASMSCSDTSWSSVERASAIDSTSHCFVCCL